MLFPVNFRRQPNRTVFSGPKKVQNICAHRRKHSDSCVNAVIVLCLDKGKHHHN